jgi:hypothetical protein
MRHVAPLEVVGEVPRADVAGLEPDQRVVAGPRSVRLALLGAEVPHSDLSHEVALGRTEYGSALQLDPAIRRLMLVDEHRRPRIVPQVPHLHVVSARHHFEAAVAPAVPDWRKEHVAAQPVGREDRDERSLEQPVEVVRV